LDDVQCLLHILIMGNFLSHIKMKIHEVGDMVSVSWMLCGSSIGIFQEH
jgi:hypothetical protein